MRVVAAGDALLAPSVTRRLIAEFARQPAYVETASDTFATLLGVSDATMKPI